MPPSAALKFLLVFPQEQGGSRSLPARVQLVTTARLAPGPRPSCDVPRAPGATGPAWPRLRSVLRALQAGSAWEELVSLLGDAAQGTSALKVGSFAWE